MPVKTEITTTDWATAIGRVGSVVVAGATGVYFWVLQPRRRRPKLTLGEPEDLIAPLRFANIRPRHSEMEVSGRRIPVAVPPSTEKRQRCGAAPCRA